MFKELKALLQNRSLTLTVATMKDGKIRVCVIPQSTEKDEAANKTIGYKDKEVAKIPDAAISALTTPLSLTGTAEELDVELPTLLAHYVEKHVGLQQSFDHAAQQIEDAVKAIRERDKSKTKSKGAASKQDDEDKAADKGDGRQTPEPKKKVDELPSLWCAAANNAPATGSADAAPATNTNQ